MPAFAHSLETRAKAVAMLRSGVQSVEVARTLRIPRGTIGWWRHEDRRKPGQLPAPHSRIVDSPRCSDAELARQPYAYLLGLYLGDGHTIGKKQQHTLGISCSDCWPGLMDACEAAMRAVMPHNKVWRRACKEMHEVMSSSIHWTCLFPQHGPGRKHERPIVLGQWQQEIVSGFPEDFIRGLIHSDGCRVYNVAIRTRNGKTTRYYYSRYHFTKNISIARRESVRRLDSFVGPKR